MEVLNGNISLGEVQAVLQMQRVGIAPGPDEIYSDLLLHAGKQLQSAIHLIYSNHGKRLLYQKTGGRRKSSF